MEVALDPANGVLRSPLRTTTTVEEPVLEPTQTSSVASVGEKETPTKGQSQTPRPRTSRQSGPLEECEPESEDRLQAEADSAPVGNRWNSDLLMMDPSPIPYQRSPVATLADESAWPEGPEMSVENTFSTAVPTRGELEQTGAPLSPSGDSAVTLPLRSSTGDGERWVGSLDFLDPVEENGSDVELCFFSDGSPGLSPRLLLVYTPSDTSHSRLTISSIASPLRTPLSMSPRRLSTGSASPFRGRQSSCSNKSRSSLLDQSNLSLSRRSLVDAIPEEGGLAGGASKSLFQKPSSPAASPAKASMQELPSVNLRATSSFPEPSGTSPRWAPSSKTSGGRTPPASATSPISAPIYSPRNPTLLPLNPTSPFLLPTTMSAATTTPMAPAAAAAYKVDAAVMGKSAEAAAPGPAVSVGKPTTPTTIPVGKSMPSRSYLQTEIEPAKTLLEQRSNVAAHSGLAGSNAFKSNEVSSCSSNMAKSSNDCKNNNATSYERQSGLQDGEERLPRSACRSFSCSATFEPGPRDGAISGTSEPGPKPRDSASSANFQPGPGDFASQSLLDVGPPSQTEGGTKARAASEGPNPRRTRSPAEWHQLYLQEVGRAPANADQFRAFVVHRGGDLPYVVARRALLLR